MTLPRANLQGREQVIVRFPDLAPQAGPLDWVFNPIRAEVANKMAAQDELDIRSTAGHSGSSHARRRHAPRALLQLAGRQRTYTAVHEAHTPTARIALVLGQSVIYLSEPRTVTALHRAWTGAQLDVRRVPLQRPVFDANRDPSDSAEPAFVVHAKGAPSAGHRLNLGTAGSPEHVAVWFGRVVFEIYDQVAWQSCLMSIEQAKRETTQGVFDQWTPGLEPVLFRPPEAGPSPGTLC